MNARTTRHGASKPGGLAPLPLGSLGPPAIPAGGDRVARTPLTALLDGAGTEAGLASPSLWLRTPPVLTPSVELPSIHQGKLFPPGASPRTAAATAAAVSSAAALSNGIREDGGSKLYNVDVGSSAAVRVSGPVFLNGKDANVTMGIKDLNSQQKPSEHRFLHLQQRQEQQPQQQQKQLQQPRFHAQQPQQPQQPQQSQQPQLNLSNPEPQPPLATQTLERPLQSQGHTVQPIPRPQKLQPAPVSQQESKINERTLPRARALLPAPLISPNPGTAAAAPLVFPKDLVAKRILPLDKTQIPPTNNNVLLNGISVVKAEPNSTQIARAIRNREAASKSRHAAKLKVKRLEEENKRLKERVLFLEEDNNTLRQKLGLPLLESSEEIGTGDTKFNGAEDTQILPSKRARKK